MDYLDLVKCYSSLEGTTKRLEKVDILSGFLKKVKKDELMVVVHLFKGRVFPDWDNRKIGVSSRLLLKAISQASGVSQEKVEREWARKGDLGEVTCDLIKNKKQRTLFSSKLTIRKVVDNFEKLVILEGEGTVNRKLQLLSELLTSAKPLEAKYIVRTGLEDLRIGVKAGVLRDAIAKAFDKDAKDVENSYNILVDYGDVALKAKGGVLGKVKVDPSRPLKVQLALISSGIEECFEALGKPAQFEYKLDGFRVLINKSKGKVFVYTRAQEDVTKQFPDLVEAVGNIKGKNFIIDGEAVAHDGKKYLPFQVISQRIKRKYGIKEMSKKYPVELDVFDVLYYEGKSFFNKPLIERRKFLEDAVKEKKWKIMLTKKLVTSSLRDAEKFYKKALMDGEEGVIIKNLESLYRPGRYVGGWMKLKNVLEPLDLVIVKAEYGTGKRAGWLTSYTLACKSDSGLLEVGKVSTGVKEKSEGLTYKELTKMLKPLITKTKGKEVVVKPRIVLEVGYEEVQKSQSYGSGYGLRFPRVLRERGKDKGVDEINSISDVKKIYLKQRGKNTSRL